MATFQAKAEEKNSHVTMRLRV